MSELRSRGARCASPWSDNPVLVHLFGLSPMLAVADSAGAAAGLGLAVALVVFTVALPVRLLGKRWIGHWRYVGYLLLLSVITTMLALATAHYLAPLSARLGIYLPLLCCNFAILLRLDDYRTLAPAACLSDAARLGAGYFLALIIFGSLRELLVSGTLFADVTLLMPQTAEPGEASRPDTTDVFGFAALAPGGFILLGLLTAAKAWLDSLLPARARQEPAVTPAARARVTGKITEN